MKTKDIKGYEGLYEIDEDGTIRGKDRQIKHKDGGVRNWAGRTLKTDLRKGYPWVTLSKNGQRRSLAVHILVLETFVGSSPEGSRSIHIDNDPGNAEVANLKWSK